jgi:radical SAM protein with 4Fe4S-binding SPASM domain
MFGDNSGGCEICGIRGIIGVLADGSYALCGIGTSVPEMVFGRAGDDDLRSVWETNEILNRIRMDLPERLEGICGQCVLKEICLGRCIAQNYYTSHSLWAPFWYCEEARRSGLFPPSRLAG